MRGVVVVNREESGTAHTQVVLSFDNERNKALLTWNHVAESFKT